MSPSIRTPGGVCCIFKKPNKRIQEKKKLSVIYGFSNVGKFGTYTEQMTSQYVFYSTSVFHKYVFCIVLDSDIYSTIVYKLYTAQCYYLILQQTVWVCMIIRYTVD
jgi:hypothetical protein